MNHTCVCAHHRETTELACSVSQLLDSTAVPQVKGLGVYIEALFAQTGDRLLKRDRVDIGQQHPLAPLTNAVARARPMPLAPPVTTATPRGNSELSAVVTGTWE